MLHLNALFAVPHLVEIVGDHGRKVQNAQVQQADEATHELYLRSWDEDISSQARAQGRLANEIPVAPDSLGLPLEIEFFADSERPRVWLADALQHALGLEQGDGISDKRHHDILAELGHFDGQPEAES